jgi:hypothetical protein
MSTPAFGVRARATYPTIVKRQRELRLCPNLADYDRTCHHFIWHAARLMLEGLPGGRGLNIAHEAVDRQCLAQDRQDLDGPIRGSGLGADRNRAHGPGRR